MTPKNLPTPGFEFLKITFPTINCLITAVPKDSTYNQSFKMDVLISSNNLVSLLFGIQVQSAEKFRDRPTVQMKIDAFCEFKTNLEIPEDVEISNIPMLGNMMAAMYPFLRERAHYCLSGGGIQGILPPINVVQILKDNETSNIFKITDTRKSADSETINRAEVKA